MEHSFVDRLRYRFDRLLSKGSTAAIGWVVALAVILAAIGGIVFWLFGIEFDGRTGAGESFWRAFLFAVGRGEIGGGNWSTRAASFVFVFAGVFLTGSLVGVLVGAVTQRLDELRRGRGPVLEKAHTVIAGWSPRLMAILGELLAENPDGRNVIAVVLADRDKQEMEDDFRNRYRGTERDRVLFRSGNPSLPSDLRLVGVEAARSVIVLSTGDFVDAVAVRRALAAQSLQQVESRVIAEMTNPRVATSLVASTGGAVEVVSVEDVVADMLAQAIRRQGLARVFDELLSFGGSEIYLMSPGPVAGFEFADAVERAGGVSIVGLVSEKAELLPHRTRKLETNHTVIALAEDAGTVVTLGEVHEPIALTMVSPNPGIVTVIGWNPMMASALDRLGTYLPPESRIEVLCDTTLLDGGAPAWRWSVPGRFRHTKHDPDEVLSMISDAGPNVIVVAGYADRLSHEEADSLTLLTLLMLQDARHDGKLAKARIVSQLFDRELAPLARVDHRDDVVITDALASRLLVHASRNPALAAIYRDLFDPAGPVVDMVPAPTGHLSYGSMVASLADQGMASLGLLFRGDVILNPPRAQVFNLHAGDMIVVIRRV